MHEIIAKVGDDGLTVGDLRELIDGLPDDTPVVCGRDIDNTDVCYSYTIRSKNLVGLVEYFDED